MQEIYFLSDILFASCYFTCTCLVLCLFNLYFNLRKTHMCLETLFIKFSTGLFHFASSLNVIPKCLWEYLYRKTGWERLVERRTWRKLQLFYNIQNGSTPPYLLDLMPPTIQSTTIYPWNSLNVSRLRTERLRLFHYLTVAGTKESLAKESLQNGTIISLPFRRG
jgi:hypothetical protein